MTNGFPGMVPWLALIYHRMRSDGSQIMGPRGGRGHRYQRISKSSYRNRGGSTGSQRVSKARVADTMMLLIILQRTQAS